MISTRLTKMLDIRHLVVLAPSAAWDVPNW
jgi:hypothetical protein